MLVLGLKLGQAVLIKNGRVDPSNPEGSSDCCIRVQELHTHFDEQRCVVQATFPCSGEKETFTLTPAEPWLTLDLGDGDDDTVKFKVLSLDTVVLPGGKIKKFSTVSIGIEAAKKYHIVREELFRRRA